MIIRFDDICLNTDMLSLRTMARHAMRLGHDVWLCVSLFCHGDAENQRVHPRYLNDYSDYRRFYRVDRVGVPAEVDVPGVKICSHGLIHVDHRLLSRGEQALSILASCSLLSTQTFVPPFNKWNQDTESICAEHGLRLIKFEEGWLSMEHNEFKTGCDRWYLHPNGFTPATFAEWFDVSSGVIRAAV